MDQKKVSTSMAVAVNEFIILFLKENPGVTIKIIDIGMSYIEALKLYKAEPVDRNRKESVQ